MDQAFSRRVTSPGWLDEAHAWVHTCAEAAGRALAGPIEQRRVRPWSTQLVVPTDHGRLWFKANCRSMAFEPALHALLADVAPDQVAAPLAVDADRGWMITADRGETLGDTREPTLADWRGVMIATGRLQRRLATHRDAVLATGVPDCSPAGVPARFDGLLDALGSLPAEHPSALGLDVVQALLARRPLVEEAAARLASSTVPVTVQHGDVHPWNAFADLRVFDFGDLQWAHALEVLSVPEGWITTRSEIAWDDVLATYAELWSDVADPRDFAELQAAVAFTQPVNRALTWWESLQEATDEEWREWGDAPAHHLRRVLEA
jgi:hypothetical protein